MYRINDEHNCEKNVILFRSIVKKSNISELRVVVTSFFVDLLDVLVNLIISILTGSVVMFSEFLQGLTDLVSAGLLLIGHKLSKKKPSKRYPFGYGKEIYFWSLISAVIMMTLTASGSIIMGMNRFFHPEEVSHILIAFATLVFSILTNGYALSLSYRRLMKGKSFRQLRHEFLYTGAIATKNAFVLDLMGTSAAVSGLVSLLIYQVFDETRADAVGSIVIGVLTAFLAFILIIGIKGFLVGKRADPRVEDKIRKVALTIPQVKEVLDLRTMQIGSNSLLVNMEVHMQDRLTTDELEKLIDKIKNRLLKEVPSIQHIQVELETP